MSLRYLIRRRAVKVNNHRGIKVGEIIRIENGDIHFLMQIPGRGIGQHTIPGASRKSLANSIRHGSLDGRLVF